MLDAGQHWAGLPGDALAWALADVASSGRWFVVTPTPERADELCDALRTLMPGRAVLGWPADDVRPYGGFSPHPRVVAERTATLAALDAGRQPVVVLPAVALRPRYPAPSVREAGTTHLAPEVVLDREEWLEGLVAAGYLATDRVEDPGCFAVRGEVLDLWPADADKPVRVHFFDDEVEEIRQLDPVTQRQGAAVDAVTVLPAREERLDRDALRQFRREAGRLVTEQARGNQLRRRFTELVGAGIRSAGLEAWLPALVDTEPASHWLQHGRLVVVDPVAVGNALLDHQRAASQAWSQQEDEERPLVTPEQRYVDAETALGWLADAHRVVELAVEGESVDLGARPLPDLHVRDGELQPVVDRLRGWADDGARVLVTVASQTRAQRVLRLLEDRLEVQQVRERSKARPGRVSVWVAPLELGFEATGSGWVVVPGHVIFARQEAARKPRSAARAFLDAAVTSLAQLKEGDAVVHSFHGIGRYLGLDRLEVSGSVRDFVKLEYRGGDTLMLPITGLAQLSRYTPSHGDIDVKLDKLGGKSWAVRIAKVKDSVLRMAHELIQLYAHRKLATRPPHPPIGPRYTAFEEAFPYEETPDQRTAIEALHVDLEDEEPMDRLIVGDVGFGKTEVAMRAAMRVVEGGRQVAVLCPTTVLAYQHVRTFRERFAGQGVRVDMLSRLKEGADAREVLQKLKDGELDIVIGTHQLLGRSVRFRDLGLVVVDEEHRFGVKQKEQLKKRTAGVDVLAMSATPIPRTLQMALGGVRSMSIIATPPPGRMSVRTAVARLGRTRVRESILFELSRGGQVFFVHNRVQDLDGFARKLQQWVPEARFGTAHGQMKAADLESVLLDFVNRRFDVLVCTSIIESGIDMPQVNTLLVDRADRFGLAQLYQLRGRVGRSDRRAYCVLFTEQELTKEAQRRLQVLTDHSDLGSGFAVASADLDLRGAGSLVGERQSGNIDSIGFEAWVELLEQAVQEASGRRVQSQLEPEVEVPVEAVLPGDWIPEVEERLAWYQKLSTAPTPAYLDSLLDELESLFGEPPPAAVNLVGVLSVRLECQRLGIERVSWLKVRAMFEVTEPGELTQARLEAWAAKMPKRMKLAPRTEGGWRVEVRFTPEEGERPLRFLRWWLALLDREPER